MDGVPGLSPVAGCRQSEHILRTDWMSALPPKADIGTELRNVRFVPKADIGEAARNVRPAPISAC
jgi:hypothetical protein